MDNDYNIISHNKNYFYETVVSKQVLEASMINKNFSNDVINLKKVIIKTQQWCMLLFLIPKNGSCVQLLMILKFTLIHKPLLQQ